VPKVLKNSLASRNYELRKTNPAAESFLQAGFGQESRASLLKPPSSGFEAPDLRPSTQLQSLLGSGMLKQGRFHARLVKLPAGPKITGKL
jgi:hypothetical protein